jgi:DNA-binding ferritin-like protein
MALITVRQLQYFNETGNLVMPSAVPKDFKKTNALASGPSAAPEGQFVKKLTMDPNVDPNHDIGNETMLGEWSGVHYGELSVLLVYLRYLQKVHQTHHWIAKGDPFYGDHQLFERLYNATSSDIDSLAEKAVGLGSERNVDLSLQLKQLEKLCSGAYGMSQLIPQSTELFKRSLAAEKNFLKVLGTFFNSLREQGLLTPGLENLLGGIADIHESHVYLLKQRCSSGMP